MKFLFLVLTFFSGVALGGDPVAPLELIKYEYEDFFLKLEFEEKTPAAQACDLVWTKGRFFRALDELSLEFSAVRFCPLDRRGKRKGFFSWKVPLENRRKGDFKLIVNKKQLGILRLSGGQPSFEKEEE